MRFANCLRGVSKLANAFGGLLYVVLFLIFILQVVARFVFNQPLPWTDELVVILYIWVILWAAAFMVPEREHVVFDLVYHAASPQVRRLMRITSHLMIGGLAAWALPASWSYIHFMAREGTPVLGLPFMWVFLPFALLLVSLIARGIWQIALVVREFIEEKK